MGAVVPSEIFLSQSVRQKLLNEIIYRTPLVYFSVRYILQEITIPFLIYKSSEQEMDTWSTHSSKSGGRRNVNPLHNNNSLSLSSVNTASGALLSSNLIF